jgi:hypothetical protein
MPSYTLPEPRSTGPTVEDLKDRLLAIEPLDVAVRPTKYGEKLVAHARVVAINADGSWEDLGDVRFAQMVLAEELQRVLENQAGWLVARVIRPNKAWLFEPPDDSERDLVDKVMADITGDDEPSF